MNIILVIGAAVTTIATAIKLEMMRRARNVSAEEAAAIMASTLKALEDGEITQEEAAAILIKLWRATQ